ncbi:hypothetical protein DFH08DRAFT_1017202 [Mycena albidolilacea]|uniref:Uncharacterized protein n=1 Tax=Mycena albidolilacea TaxID=1033008 RepID=A0AAD7AQ54_9AGAR|nr:hypothetical protein DFH08DRAFT_1017202 [Mycena albidolilacea]
MRYACAIRPQAIVRLFTAPPRRSLPGLSPPILFGRTLRQVYPRAPTPSSVCPPCAIHARTACSCCADPVRTAPPPARIAYQRALRCGHPGPELFLRDASQAPRTCTSPVAVVRQPSARRPAPTAHCVPVRAAAEPTLWAQSILWDLPRPLRMRSLL